MNQRPKITKSASPDSIFGTALSRLNPPAAEWCQAVSGGRFGCCFGLDAILLGVRRQRVEFGLLGEDFVEARLNPIPHVNIHQR
jgi:hypothetical protein